MATQTPNYSFQKPTVSGDSGVWGGYLNDNFTSLDNLLGGNTVITGIDINSGSIDGTAIGANAVSTGAFSTVTVDNITIDGQQITSTNTNGNIQLFANGTGYVELYGNTNPGAVRFNCENNSHGVTLKGPAHSAGATYSLELPDADGSAGTFLKTDGSGKLSFDSVGSGFITASSTDTLTNKTIAFASNTLTDVAGTTASQTITNKNIVDKVYTLTGTVIDPDNGSIQNKTLSSAPTFTQSISAGESVILQLINAAYYTVTWPTITWISTAGNVAPTFTSDSRETVVLWSPESGTICGAYLGNAKT